MWKYTLSALILVAAGAGAQPYDGRGTPDGWPEMEGQPGSGEPGAAQQPFETIRLTAGELSDKERRTVRFFFLKTCPFCRDMHAELVAWGQTLPEGIIFEPTPLISDPSMFGMARGYYSAAAVAPGRLPDYVSLVDRAIQDHGADTDGIGVYRWAAEEAGINPRQFTRAWNHDALYERMKHALELTHRYELRETPVLVIGGRYKVSPRHTNGQNTALLQVASGLVSRIIEQEGLR
jgi:thiol:disulfide interchange protein DsbA